MDITLRLSLFEYSFVAQSHPNPFIGRLEKKPLKKQIFDLIKCTEGDYIVSKVCLSVRLITELY